MGGHTILRPRSASEPDAVPGHWPVAAAGPRPQQLPPVRGKTSVFALRVAPEIEQAVAESPVPRTPVCLRGRAHLC